MKTDKSTRTAGSGTKLEAESEQEFVRRFSFGHTIKIYKTHWPDRLILLGNGQIRWIEFKRPGERPDPGQAAVLRWLKQHGYKCFVAYSADEALDWLRRTK